MDVDSTADAGESGGGDCGDEGGSDVTADAMLPPTRKRWPAPAGFRFGIDRETMLALDGPPAGAAQSGTKWEEGRDAMEGRGLTKGAENEAMEAAAAASASTGEAGGGMASPPAAPREPSPAELRQAFSNNWPRCIDCASAGNRTVGLRQLEPETGG